MKTIYQPTGKAAEYAKWACNFYNGCSIDCQYCYCKRGVMSSNWSNPPKMKSKLKDENHALEIFEKELKQNLSELQKHGLFFSFTTDPMLSETVDLTVCAIGVCQRNLIPVKVLTKCTRYFTTPLEVPSIFVQIAIDNEWDKDLLAIGFTLTGHDELEPNASPNAERIEAMKKLHNVGFKTWASIEPIIDFESSSMMILNTAGFCDLYKIGLKSGKKHNKTEIGSFVELTLKISAIGTQPKIYFKDSLLKQAGIERESLPENCVGRDYNLFKN